MAALFRLYDVMMNHDSLLRIGARKSQESDGSAVPPKGERGKVEKLGVF